MAESAPQTATATATDERTYLQKLHAGEQHWAWKFSFRVAICVLDIVGIGCAAWLASRHTNRSIDYDYFYFDYFMLPGALTAISHRSHVCTCLSVSFIWCLIVILIYLLRRPPSPIHPGICVGIDLILWLGLIVTGLFAVGAVITVASYGSGGYLDDPSYGYSSSDYSGHYALQPNNTWVYKITYVDDPCDYNYYAKGCHYNLTTGTYSSNVTKASVKRDCKPEFATCAEQDTYVNQLWHEKPLIEGTEIMVAVAQWFAVVFHFILFVWACVDTHRYNARSKRRYTQLDAQEIADKVIRDMEARGLITVHAHARPEGTEMVNMPSRPGPAMAGPSTASRGSMEIGQAR